MLLPTLDLQKSKKHEQDVLVDIAADYLGS